MSGKKNLPKHLTGDVVREIVEKAFTKAAVDKDMPGIKGHVHKLTNEQLHVIAEQAFTKAAVDKDLPNVHISTSVVREIIEAAYTKAAVDKDLPGVATKLSDLDLQKIIDATVKK